MTIKKTSTIKPQTMSAVQNRDVDEIQKKIIDEAQFVIVQKGGLKKRVRNQPELLAKIKADGWNVIQTINEVSSEKLKKYISKATDSQAELNKKSGSDRPSAIKHLHKAMNRQDFQDKASAKLKARGEKAPHIFSQERKDAMSVSQNAGAYEKTPHGENFKNKAKTAMDKLHKQMKEETINELSKKTLGSYVQHAALNMAHKAKDSAVYGEREKQFKSSEMQDYAKDRKEKAEKKMSKRYAGIDVAVKKLTKEELLGMSVDDAKELIENVLNARKTYVQEEASPHIMIQLRKTVDKKVEHKVKFKDGATHKVSLGHAEAIMRKHDALKKPSDKLAFVNKVSKSHTHLKSEIDLTKRADTSDKPSDDSKKITLAKSVKEETLSELSTGTLKSYTKKATKSADKLSSKLNKEEDKAMSTDGNKYPEKQERHNNASIKIGKKLAKRFAGLHQAKSKI